MYHGTGALTTIDPSNFVELVEPLLVRKDVPGLLQLLKTNWTPEQIRDLLRSPHSDARKVALLALALVGPCCCTQELSHQLKDPDPVINELAEHALWAIWFRSGKTPEANQLVCRGAEALNTREFGRAIKLFNQAIRSDPDFAEAYNQRAIAYYLTEDYEPSIADCRRAIRRMPCHFGAWREWAIVWPISTRSQPPWNVTSKPWPSTPTCIALRKRCRNSKNA